MSDNRSVGLSGSRSVCRPVCRTLGRSACWSVDLLVHRSVGQSVCRSRRLVGLVVGQGGRSVCWSVGQSIRRSIILHSVCWLILQKVCRYVGLSDSRSVGLSVCRSRRLVGLVVGRGGRSVCWSVGQSILVCRTVGLSVCRCQSGSRACFVEFGSSGLHFVALGVPLASFVRSWARS